jgi:hypothetical protein
MARSDEQHVTAQMSRRRYISPATAAGISAALRQAFPIPRGDLQSSERVRLRTGTAPKTRIPSSDFREDTSQGQPPAGEGSRG